MSTFAVASVNLAAAKIANVLLGWAIVQTLVVCGLINVAFAATAGLWGVLVTDQNPPPAQINVAFKLGRGAETTRAALSANTSRRSNTPMQHR